MSTKVDILGLGEGLIELLQIPGKTPPHYVQGFGGDTSNAMIAAARQGAKVGYLTAVGGDPFGTALLDLWQRENVDTTHVAIRAQDPTGVYFVQPHPSGRSFSYARRGSAASLYGPDDLPADAIAQAKVLHVSALSQAISPTMRAATFRAAEIAKAHGTLVSYDTNLRLNLWTIDEARETVAAFLPLADIVLPSDDEAAMLTGLTAPQDILAHFGAHDPAYVILKRGEKSAWLRSKNDVVEIPIPPTDAIDSTGAGDSFAGAFLAHLLETSDATCACQRAAIVAAGVVSGLGAVDPIPYRASLPEDQNVG